MSQKMRVQESVLVLIEPCSLLTKQMKLSFQERMQLAGEGAGEGPRYIRICTYEVLNHTSILLPEDHNYNLEKAEIVHLTCT